MDIDRVYKDIVDQNPYIAAYIMDAQCRLVYVNDTYLKILNMEREDVIGKPILEISPQSRMPAVLESGEPIYGYNWSVNGRNMAASSIPISQEGRIIGVFAYSVFLDILDAKEMLENLLSQVDMYKREISAIHRAKYHFEDLIGNSPEFVNIIKFGRQIAKHPKTTVLITGESGTGKELLANAIHNKSSRARNPFIRVNCAAIPENLLETELFGYEQGAYTGAKKSGKPGKFELAQGGTIFLDEIGELPLNMQSKLLTVLQEHEVERVGGSRPIPLDVRIIAATNQDLNQMVSLGRFRSDLYFRLNVVQLEMPPLRSHKEDIPIIAEHILKKHNCRLRIDLKGISEQAFKALCSYRWPGNVRELENVMERAMIVAEMEDASIVSRRHFGFLNMAFDIPVNQDNTKNLKTITEDFESEVIKRAMREANDDILTAAKILGIDRTTLYRKLKKYGIPC